MRMRPSERIADAGGKAVTALLEAQLREVGAILDELVPWGSSGEMLERVVLCIDSVDPKTRRTLLAFLGARYNSAGDRR